MYICYFTKKKFKKIRSLKGRKAHFFEKLKMKKTDSDLPLLLSIDIRANRIN